MNFVYRATIKHDATFHASHNHRVSRQNTTTASYIEDEEEEDAYNLPRTGLQLATSTDCIRVDRN